MSATNHTTNYQLPQFISSDVPTWLNDVNGAFAAIDTAIKSAYDEGADAAADAAAADHKADAVQTALDTTNLNVANLQIAQAATAQTVQDQATDITNLQVAVSGLGDQVRFTLSGTTLTITEI